MRGHTETLGCLDEASRVLDTCHVPLLDALQSQSGNDSGADTTSILRSMQHNGIIGRGPIEDLAEGLSASLLEVWILLEHRPVCANVAGA